MKALQCMSAALNTIKEKSANYKDSYLIHGQVMSVLFPDGLTLKDKDEFNRFGVLNMQVSKLIRYCQGWQNPQIDSSHDMGVYCFMQEELDHHFYAKKQERANEIATAHKKEEA